VWDRDPRVTRLAELAGTDPATWPTRERILHAAASLMAAKGYHGASTRDIADAVGIQQPSIFNHFPNKTAILEELFQYDQVIPAERLAAIVVEGGSPACQLFRYVEWQTRWYLEMPFDMRGMREEQIAEFGIDTARRAMQRFRKTLSAMVREGVTRGQFHPDGHEFLYPALNALAWEATRMARTEPPRNDRRQLVDGAASFVLRATLADAAALPEVRREASRLVDPSA
jgi:AcrR family transcriptional regulator